MLGLLSKPTRLSNSSTFPTGFFFSNKGDILVSIQHSFIMVVVFLISLKFGREREELSGATLHAC